MHAGKAPTKMTQSTLAMSSSGQGVEIRPAAAPRRHPGRSLGVKPKRTKPPETVDLTNLVSLYLLIHTYILSLRKRTNTLPFSIYF
jgi:hypothetical protein